MTTITLTKDQLQEIRTEEYEAGYDAASESEYQAGYAQGCRDTEFKFQKQGRFQYQKGLADGYDQVRAEQETLIAAQRAGMYQYLEDDPARREAAIRRHLLD